MYIYTDIYTPHTHLYIYTYTFLWYKNYSICIIKQNTARYLIEENFPKCNFPKNFPKFSKVQNVGCLTMDVIKGIWISIVWSFESFWKSNPFHSYQINNQKCKTNKNCSHSWESWPQSAYLIFKAYMFICY